MGKSSRVKALDDQERFILSWGTRGFRQDLLQEALDEAGVTYDQYHNWRYHKDDDLHRDFIEAIETFSRDNIKLTEMLLIQRALYDAYNNPDGTSAWEVYKLLRPKL